MLEQLFSKAKSKDLVIHFFDSKANKNNSCKKLYSIFKNKDEFFGYFNIIGKDKIILDAIFPEKYLTIIDNTRLILILKISFCRKGKNKKKRFLGILLTFISTKRKYFIILQLIIFMFIYFFLFNYFYCYI